MCIICMGFGRAVTVSNFLYMVTLLNNTTEENILGLLGLPLNLG